jgi:hypothetical protein
MPTDEGALSDTQSFILWGIGAAGCALTLVWEFINHLHRATEIK